MKIKHRKSLTSSITAIAVVPTIILGLMISVYSAFNSYSCAYTEIRHELESISLSIYEFLDDAHPGKFNVSDNSIEKGGSKLECFYDTVTAIKEQSGIDITLFYGPTRYITTVSHEDGSSLVGTRASEEVVERVLVRGERYFSDNISVDGIPYFGSYMPLTDPEGKIIGMIFAGRDRSEILNSVLNYGMNSLIIAWIVTSVVLSLSLIFSSKIVSSLAKATEFLGKIASGNTECTPDKELAERPDEIGDIGRSAEKLRTSLRYLISCDPLTGLLNRRSCTIRLKDMQAAAEKGTPMTVIIGDIDYFKTFNDRFGHACGDKVLKAVSGIMTRAAGEDTVVSRWGGEEFLLAFGGCEYDEVLGILNRLYEEIRTYNMAFGNDTLSITMTFGIQEYKSGMTTDDVINLADHKLYYGKNHGRDCIVDKIPSEINM